MINNELQKIPPQNIEAEQYLLGSILIDKDAIIKVADIIQPSFFYKEKHVIIYDALLELYEKREPLDLVSLSNKLLEKKKLEEIGGRSYLMELTNMVTSASNIGAYAGIVTKKATLRRLIASADRIVKLGFEEDEDIEVTLDKAEQSLFAVSQQHLQQNFVSIKETLTEAFDRIDEIHREGGKLRGAPTQFTALDSVLGGLQKSDLIILAARPSIGKTTLALDIARNIALRSKIPVGIFSLEMSKEQLVDRMLSTEAGVDLWKMRTGRLSDKGEYDDFRRIGDAMARLAEAPIYIDDTSMVNIMDIRTKARRLHTEHGVGVIIVDYLQLMEGRSNSNSDNRVNVIAEISRALKGLARELNVPVLALSQLSRSVESRTPAIPRLSDLRESGSIEQDADIVMFIYRKIKDKSQNCPDDEKHIAEIHIAKHRNGPTGMVKLYFDDEKVTFRNLEKHLSEFTAPDA
jgi:replicative DNA helicase